MTQEQKKRILFVGEASNLNTGFSNIYRELLPRLVETGKYEIAEFGSYVHTNDPRVQEFIRGRWKFYGNNPDTPEEQNEFNQPDPAQPNQNTNQFGKYKFEKVCADFKPDVVIDIRDWWMCAFQGRSPFRKYFKWLLMPTVDSIPQKEEWINTYVSCDYVMGYSDFGIDSLRKSHPKLEVRYDPPGRSGFVGIDKMPGRLHPIPLRPGVDLKTFSNRTDEERGAIKQKWGVKADVPIVLIVQRNQARKRIAEVIVSFAMMKEKYPKDEFIQKAILVIHSSWPDNALSIDFPRTVERIQRGYHGIPVTRKGIIREVCSTFMCHNQACGDVFIAPSINMRQNPTIICPKCGNRTARTPTTGFGYTREQLSEVYAMGDLLVQMSIAEGDGMPVNEAKACGVPVLVTESAALAEKGSVPNYDHIDKANYTVNLGGEIMKVEYAYEEPETCCWRVHTSREDCAEKMAKLISDRERLKQMRLEARKCAEDNYDWDKVYKNWEFILDHITPLDRSQTWDRPASLIEIDGRTPPETLSDDEFVVWCYIHLLGYKAESSIDEEGRRNWHQKLAMEAQHGVPPHKTRMEIMQYFKGLAESLNAQETLRTGCVATPESRNVDPSKIEMVIV